MLSCSHGGGVRLTGEGDAQVSSVTELTREDKALRLYLEGRVCFVLFFSFVLFLCFVGVGFYL